MKKYLSIETARKTDGKIKTVNIAKYLISENISAWIYDEPANMIRLYFQNSNPFSFILLYMSEDEFLRLCRDTKAETITKQSQASVFIYSVIAL